MFEEKDILRFISGDSDPELLKKIGELREEESFDQDLSQMSKIWDLSEELEDYQQFDTEAAWDSFEDMSSIEETAQSLADEELKTEAIVVQAPRTRRMWNWVAVAASLAILVTAAYFLLQKDYIIVGNETWAQTTILPDGSEVQLLNRSSILRYPKTFEDKTERRVHITGDAIVDVVKDESKTFYVENYKTQIEAIGTIFKIVSDSTASELENVDGIMSLFEIANAENGQKLENPGDKAIFDGGPIRLELAYVEPPPPPDTPGVHTKIIDIIDFLTSNFEEKVTFGPYVKESNNTVKVLLDQPLIDILLQLDSTAQIQYSRGSSNSPIVIYELNKK